MKSGDHRSGRLAAILLRDPTFDATKAQDAITLQPPFAKLQTNKLLCPGGEPRDAYTFVDDDGGCGIAHGFVRSSE